jgi:hypothetical protein
VFFFQVRFEALCLRGGQSVYHELHVLHPFFVAVAKAMRVPFFLPYSLRVAASSFLNFDVYGMLIT